MNRYEVVSNPFDMNSTPGIWVEQKLDTMTQIYEKTGARYMVPFNNSLLGNGVVDVNTGHPIVFDENWQYSGYRWMLLYKFNENII